MKSETTAYPCQACGSTMAWDPAAGVMACDHCGHRQAVTPAGTAVREHAFTELASLPAKPVAKLGTAFVCQNCGAQTESDQLSATCQFCGRPLVADPAAIERVAPEAVVPFGISKQQAGDALKKWTSSRWFAPGSLKKVSSAETFTGSYLPFWTYDSNTASAYTGERGEHYWVTETYTEQVNGQQVTRTRQVQHTRWHRAQGSVSRFFDDVLVPGTTTVETSLIGKLEPWELQTATPFQRNYLAGFQTVRYDIEPEQALESAKAQMASVIEDDCRDDIGGDEQRVHTVNTAYYDLAYKLMFLPVWFLSYRHAGKLFQVMVNAHTGEVVGHRPYSAIKITAAILAALIVIVGIVLAANLH
jgi:DNA-directed RNA polymerase subunit RPC12/RpoP